MGDSSLNRSNQMRVIAAMAAADPAPEMRQLADKRRGVLCIERQAAAILPCSCFQYPGIVSCVSAAITSPSLASKPKAIVIRFLSGSRLGFGRNCGRGGFGVSIRRAVRRVEKLKVDHFNMNGGWRKSVLQDAGHYNVSHLGVQITESALTRREPECRLRRRTPGHCRGRGRPPQRRRARRC